MGVGFHDYASTDVLSPCVRTLSRSLTTFDSPYVIQFSYVYDLPLGRGRAFLGDMPRWADLIVGGWKTSGTWRISDGRPLAFTVADGTLIPTYGGGSGTLRPNLVGTPKRNNGSDPADFTLGDAPRTLGSVRTPTHFTTDLTVGKQFPIREAMNLEFRLDARNAFNHPVFGTPNTSVDDPNFGTVTSTSVGPRELQLGFRFNF